MSSIIRSIGVRNAARILNGSICCDGVVEYCGEIRGGIRSHSLCQYRDGKYDGCEQSQNLLHSRPSLRVLVLYHIRVKCQAIFPVNISCNNITMTGKRTAPTPKTQSK